MRIRNLRQGDAGQISELVGECGPYVVPYNDYAYWMLENYYYSTCLVAEKDGRIVGFVSGMPSVERNCIFIWQLCVRENFRQQGIAGALLDSLLTRAKKLDFERIELSITEGNKASQNLFGKFALGNNLELKEKGRETFGDTDEIIYIIDLI